MMVDTTIYGWVLEGEIICAKCADLNYWSPGIERLLGDNVQPLYSIDDNEVNGTTCDAYGASSDCTGYVFEPVCGECYASGGVHEDAELEYQDDTDTHLCRECRDKADES
jgi:hypothetical protein